VYLCMRYQPANHFPDSKLHLEIAMVIDTQFDLVYFVSNNLVTQKMYPWADNLFIYYEIILLTVSDFQRKYLRVIRRNFVLFCHSEFLQACLLSQSPQIFTLHLGIMLLVMLSNDDAIYHILFTHHAVLRQYHRCNSLYMVNLCPLNSISST
jgi:hypothetical protein